MRISGTSLLLIINSIIFIFTNKQTLTTCGLHPKDLEIEKLLTYQFIHYDSSHLIWNGITLLMFGSIIEREIGPKKLILFFITGGIFSGIFTTFFHEEGDLIIGSSGSIWGLIGIFFMMISKKRDTISILTLLLIIINIGITTIRAFSGLSGEISYACHLGGFLSGLFMWIPIKKTQ